MKKSLTILLLQIFAIPLVVSAQNLSIVKNDMPSPGDTFVYSIPADIPFIQAGNAGAGVVWDYSDLQHSSQYVDTFHSLQKAPGQIRLIFKLSGANLLQRNTNFTGGNALPVEISDVYRFYGNTFSEYAMLGYGLQVNGMNVPVLFSQKDRIYDFPLKFGTTDSSFSFFQFPQFPGIEFYFEQEHTRIDTVDGWGKLITPYGTFDVLRVKSVNYYVDSFSVQGNGTRTRLPKFVEYKWLGKNKGVPLLYIAGNEIAGNFRPGVVRYQDSFRAEQDTGSEDTLTSTGPANKRVQHFKIYPHPAKDKMNVRYKVSSPGYGAFIVLDLKGKLVYRKELRNTPGWKTARIIINDLPSGSYIGVIKNKGKVIFWQQFEIR